MAKKLRKKTSTVELIRMLKAKSRETKQKFWRDLAERLQRPRRIMPAVNIEKIEKLAGKHGDKLFIVPGKLLGKGKLSKAVRVAAFSFSKKAKEQVESNKGKLYTLKELLDMKVKGSEVFIVQ